MQSMDGLDTGHANDTHTNLADFLLIAAQHEPDHIAVETDTTCYTYAQLVRMVASVQVVLRRALDRCEEVVAARQAALNAGEHTVSPLFHRRRPTEHVVCIVLERGPECLAAVHATMLEGCAYNTFDVAEPREKLQTWVEIAQHPVMVTSRPVMSRLGLMERGWEMGSEYPRFVIDVHKALRKVEKHVHTTPPPVQRPSDLDRLCYVIFTSGSTGKPKAVMIQHRSACNLVRVWSDFVGVRPDDRLAQMASMAFDNHVAEVYGAMHKKCTSVVVPDLMKRSGPDMVSWLASKHVNVMVTVPSHLRSMSGPGSDVSTAALPHLRVLDIGGEALGKDVLDAWAPGRCMFNIYGPTEITVVCAGTRVRPGDEITIGYDLPTYHNHVLDPETLKECPTGVRGVLYTGGVGTARGYLDDEEKTTTKFVHIPELGRMYCSGDVVSKDEQGRFHYHGRADWQVKVRGIRIELEALEEAVGSMPGVKHCEARVIAGGSQLALIASGSELSEAGVKEVAAKLGKGYQLNVVKLVAQSAWKFNTSGKLVRNHVPLDDCGQQKARQADSWESFAKEEVSELELEIARCVGQLVSAAAWHKESHFIEELGLDSAGFGKLITLLRRKPFLQLVDLPMLFDNPTVSALATAVERRRSTEALEDSDAEHLDTGETGETLLDLLLSKTTNAADPRCVHASCVQTQADTMTYAQLLSRAIALQGLLKKSLRACDSSPRGKARIVLLLLDPSADLFAAMAAAVLERHAFCIMDSTWAKAKVLDTIRAVQPCAIFVGGVGAQVELSQQDLHGIVRGPCPLVCVHSPAVSAGGVQKPILRPRTGAPFCCVTVSENTCGRLKVLVWEHEAVSWAARAWWAHMGLRPEDRALHLFQPNLMQSTVAFWATLAAGACVLIPPVGTKPGTGLRTWLFKQRPSVLGAGPLQLRILSAVGASSQASLRLVFAAGQHCRGDLAVRWSQNRRFTYAYTSPEMAAACAFDMLPETRVARGETLPLGKAFAGCQFCVLGEHLDPLPSDAVGSLVIYTPGMAAGYLDPSDSLRPLVRLPNGQRAFATGLAAKTRASGTIALVTAAEASFQRVHQSIAAVLSNGSASPISVRSVGTARATPSPTSQLSFWGYLIVNGWKGVDDNPYGEDAALILCSMVQTAVILTEPLMGAVGLVAMERIIGPYAMKGDLYLVIMLLVVASFVQQALQILAAILLKWLLIGRYREGDYAIYSSYYLKHWIVDRFASGSLLGGGRSSQGGWNFSLGRNFMKVLALKALGTKVSLSCIVTARVVGFDLISIGPLASVHGPHHLSAVNYVGKRMLIGRVRIGQGATVCHGSSISATAVVDDGAFVEPLSTVPSGMVAKGQWSGVPGRQVMPSRRSGHCGEPYDDDLYSICEAAARRLVLASGGLALLSVPLLPLQLSTLILTLWLGRMLIHLFHGPNWYQGKNVDTLPGVVMDNLWLLSLATILQTLLQLFVQLLMPVLACRLLPKIRPPMDLPLYHWKAMIAGLKVFLASAASQELGDASLQAPYLRLLGTRIGCGSSMSEQTLLPDTVTIGKRCFFASGNILTSIEVDQGRMRVLSSTEIGDGCFLGNENHVAAGLRDDTFVGLRTWVPAVPDGAGSLFGNPAMKFGRPAPAEGAMDGTITQKAWHHFSTNAIDLLLWRILYAASTSSAFILGRLIFPEYSSERWPLEFVAEVLLFAGIRVLAWLLVSIGFCYVIYNDRMPLSAPYYSSVITRWFNANKIRRVFQRPFRTAGSFWDASVLRLMGVHVGRRFFSPNQDVMIDPVFGRLGDDITVDYDGQVRQHSFEDDVLKWGPYRIGSGTNIAQAAMVAMSECAEDVTLLHGSVTWKGQTLETGAHEGAPAVPMGAGRA